MSASTIERRGRRNINVRDRAYWSDFLNAGVAAEVAERLRNHQQTGRPFGDAAFIARLEDLTARPLKHKRVGGKLRPGDTIPISATSDFSM